MHLRGQLLRLKALLTKPSKFTASLLTTRIFSHTQRTEDEGNLSVLLCRLQVVKLVFLHARVLLEVDIKRRQMKNEFRHRAKLSTELQFLFENIFSKISFAKLSYRKRFQHKFQL